MQLLFPKGATREQKVFIILLLSVAVFLPFVFLSNTLINENVVFLLAIIVIIASILSIVFFVRVLSDKTSVFLKNIRENRERPIIVILFLCLIAPFILYTSISIGIPSALHILLSEPGELMVTVKSKPSSYSERYHHGGVYVEEYNYFLNDKVYGINKTDWDSMVPGDKLRLLGKKSYLGFSYNQYEKLTSR